MEKTAHPAPSRQIIGAAFVSLAALLLASLPGKTASASTIIGAPGTRSIVEWQDPFWQGGMLQTSYLEHENASTSEANLGLLAGYGWDTGIAVSALVPITLVNSPPTFAGATTPRVAGGLDERLRLNGLFRFWGDAYDYLAIQVGVGLPYQFDGALQNSRYDSWNFPIQLLGRIDGSWIALGLTVTDNVTAPAATVGRTGNQIYEDGTNIVVATATVLFYPTRFISPFIEFENTFPSALDTANNDSANALITNISNTGSSQSYWVGVNFAPFKTGIVLNLQGGYINPPKNSSDTIYGFQGGARWVF